MRKAVVLSSGGVDSTTCLALAVETVGAENVTSLSFKYGQKHTKELECASQVAEYYKVNHKVIDLTPLNIFEGSSCSLLEGSEKEIRHQSYEEQIKEDGEGKVDSYVPFRNGLLISIAAAVASSLYEEEETLIFLGAHADDAAGEAYADCSKEFTRAIGSAIKIGTYEKCYLITPFVTNTKSEVVKKGLMMNVPYELTWSCYEGGNKPCGECGTCIDRQKAFEENGVKDPLLN